MLLLKSSLSPKIFNQYTLLAICAILICYELWIFRETTMSAVPMTLRPKHGRPVHQRPAQEETGIPRILWYKLGPSGLRDDTQSWTDTCIKANPDYRAEFISDETDDQWVRDKFAFRPDIVEVYTRLKVPIFKADILRYLLLFDQGGIWSDLDVSCEGIPIDEWVPAEYKADAGLVVGWEFDVGWEGDYIRQFTSWTIMSKPKSPHMMQVIDDILYTLREKMRIGGFSIEEATRENIGDVVDFTGPRRLTFSIYASLSKQLNRTVSVDDMKQIYQPKLIGDVLVMPGKSFAASSNTYRPEDELRLPPKLVQHHYAGTWKNDHGGE